jgi:hypothetical protein
MPPRTLKDALLAVPTDLTVASSADALAVLEEVDRELTLQEPTWADLDVDTALALRIFYRFHANLELGALDADVAQLMQSVSAKVLEVWRRDPALEEGEPEDEMDEDVLDQTPRGAIVRELIDAIRLCQHKGDPIYSTQTAPLSVHLKQLIVAIMTDDKDTISKYRRGEGAWFPYNNLVEMYLSANDIA